MPLKDREAHKAYCKAQYRAKHEERLVANRAYSASAAGQARDARKYKKHRSRIRTRQSAYHKRTYGLSPEAFDAMLISQDGRCALCDGPFSAERWGRFEPVIDHDHATGAVRSLIHRRCNIGLGQFQDDSELLRKAAAYLEAHSGTA